eukprot:c33311_g1_i1 orf=34-219(-)
MPHLRIAQLTSISFQTLEQAHAQNALALVDKPWQNRHINNKTMLACLLSIIYACKPTHKKF